MNDRYVVLSRRGEPVVRTNSDREAAHWARRLGGKILDRKQEK